MKQRYSLRSNAVKFRAMALIVIALMTGGNVVYAWTPSGAGVYHLRTNANDNSKFDVYKENANGNLPSTPTASSQSQLNGFTIYSGTYRFVFENTSTITMYGQIYINASVGTQAHLIMELGTPPSNGNPANPTLKIIGVVSQSGSGQDVAFFIANKYNLDRTKHTITIQGNNDANSSTTNPSSLSFANNFVIDGDGPEFETVDGNTMAPKAKVTKAGNKKNYGMFRIQQGTLNLKNVTIQNFSTTWGNAGVIQVFVNQSNSAVKADVDHCLFKNITGKANGFVLKLQTNGQQFTNSNVDYRNTYFRNCEFEKIYGFENPPATLNEEKAIDRSEGVLRSVGNNKTTLEVSNCHFNENMGCPIRWHGCGTTTPMVVDNCIIENSFTGIDNNQVFGGGGMLLKGPATLTKCIIRNNRTNGSGGGIYLSTYVDFGPFTPDLIPEHSILHLDPTTEIYNNTAQQNGGGVAVEAKRMFNNSINNTNNTYLPTTGGYIYWTAVNGQPNEPFRVEFQQNGGKVYGNTANGSYGGGVFINRESQCTYYGVVCKLDYGEITGNTATNGGGVAIVTTQDYNNPNIIPSNVYPQDVSVEVSGVNLNQQMLVQGNTASVNGGGIYLEAYSIDYNNVTSNVNTSVYDNAVVTKNSASANGGGLYVEEGTIRIQGATFGGEEPTLGNKAGGSGGGIYLNTGVITMLSTTVKHNNATGGHGGGIYLGSGDISINPNEIGTGIRSNISYNKAGKNGGGIYNAGGKLIAYGSFAENNPQDYQIQVTHNEADSSGGGIYCKGNTNPNSGVYDIRLRRVKIASNKAGISGGGIYLDEGKISIINGVIDSDTATVSGGGVYTRKGDIDINVTRDERQSSQITNNTAGVNGGGLNTHEGFIRVFGNSRDQRITINGNTALGGSGGGMFCMGGNANTEYITVLHADLKNNQAKNGNATNAGDGVTPGCGGGMYLQHGIITVTDVSIQGNYANYNGGGINNHSGSIDVNGCLVGGTSDYNGSTGEGNKADHSGGGIYTNLGDIDIEDYVETEGGVNRYESKITHNIAIENGGGINTHQGTITINGDESDDQIEISYNKANKGGGMYADAGTIIAYNALIHDNTANENGGGINNHSGDISIYGGTLSNNTATEGNGGGAYTHVGDINIWPFNPTNKTMGTNPLVNLSLNDGTKIYNNLAKMNGGGLNNHTGLIDVRYATLQNNTATLGNGGGIYCEGPHAAGTGFTIRLLASMLNQNKTRGQDGTEAAPTGRGGGIYLHYGRIFAQGTSLTRNKANINGGAINNHQGNIRVYGCELSNNVATTGKGGGIYANQGLIVVGPCGLRGSSMISNNTAAKNGGGIDNHEGNIQINGDYILNNSAGENGGGIYLAVGDITMNGGKIDGNTAGQKGGGVYVGGTKSDGTGFIIQERTASMPTVEIIDVKDVGTNYAVVHYHVVDDGNGGLFPSSVTYGVEGDCSSSNHTSIGDIPGCRKDTIFGLQSNYSYTVHAWAQNGTPALRAVSGDVTFTTLSNKPVVYTGTVSNVTDTTAMASGKLIYKGGSDVKENKIGILYSTDKNMPEQSTDTVLVSNIDTVFREGRYFTLQMKYNRPANPYDQQKIYFRAFAKNATETGYGDLDSIVPPKHTPDMGNGEVQYEFINNNTEVKFSYTMPSMTGLTAYGFVYSDDDDPELHSDHTDPGTPDPNNSNTFYHIVPISVMNPATNYYVRAYASSSPLEASNPTATPPVTPAMDITNYSITPATRFVSPNGDKPVVRWVSFSHITQNSAEVTGEFIYRGGYPITDYGVCYTDDESHFPPTLTHVGASGDTHCFADHGPNASSMQSGSVVTGTLNNLHLNTTYYIRLFAINSNNDTVYGNDFNFTTLPLALPHVVIDSVTRITRTSAKINCSLDNGGETVSEYGIRYGQGEGDGTKIEGTDLSNGTFSVTIDGTLSEHQTYWVKAYAINSAGTHICPQVSFTTEYDKPSVVLDNIDDLVTVEGTGTNPPTLTGTGNYTVTLAGGLPVLTHGVCWSTFHNPTRNQSDVANTHFRDGTGTISENSSKSTAISQRFPNMKYYARAYVSTATPNDVIDPDNPQNNTYSLNDIVYCNDERAFLTLPIMQSNGASNITSTSATLAGTIASRDPEHYLIKYGVCWGTSENPTPNNNPTNPNYREVAITAASSTTRPFSFNVTGLTPYDPANPQSYHYRAYAINRNGKAGTNFAFALDSIAYGPDVTFETTQYTITAVALPSAGGTVTGGGGYNHNATCTLDATVTSGGDYNFSGWYCNNSLVTESTQQQFTVTRDSTFEARYNSKVTLTAADEHGQVSFDNSNWAATQNGYYAYNASCTAYAQASTGYTGYTFVNWTTGNRNEVSTDNPYTFNVTDATELTANFSNQYDVTVSANPEEGGTVTGTGTYTYGDQVTVTATANDGYTFSSMTVDGNPVTTTNNSYTLTVSGNHTVVATFTQRGRTTSRPRDIYPAPAQEPWDWDDDFFFPTDTLRNGSKEVVNPVNIPQIDNNSAEYGGGVYVDKNESNPAKIVFAGGSTAETTGTINQNYASEAGGGVYINESASMQMKGHCHVNSNHVPEGKKGGGIYLDGVLKVGENPDDLVDAHALQVNENWAGNDGYVYDPTNPNLNNRNNVYLPEDPIPLPTADANLDAGNKQRVITLLSDISGTYTIVTDPGEITEYYSKIGLSVDHGYRAVIYTQLNNENNEPLTSPAREPWLTDLITSGSLNGAIFDDADKYYALHISNPVNPDNLKPQYDYLYGCWTTEVTSDPGTDHINQDGNGVYHIKTNRGLAWFTSIVNGLNGQEADSSAKAVLEADVDMSEHLWVPIGSVKQYAGGTGTSIVFDDSEGAFTGEFNGQGNLITGLKCYFVTGIKRYGLFGTVTSANNHVGKVWNTFVDDYRFHAFRMGDDEEHKYAYRMGGIASELTGSATISACEARGVMNTPAAECDFANTYKGGLVGKMSGQADIHSSMAMPTMQGQADYVGGLVGQLGENNKLLNSFSNAKYPDASYTMSVGKYIGGLVGENNGIVENCYSRLQGNEPTSDGTNSVFGWLAGTNTFAASGNAEGGIRFCYIPKGKNVFVKALHPDGILNQDFGSGTMVGNEAPYGHGKYDSTLRVSGKYGFKHRDHKIYDKDETLVATDYTKYVNSTINDTLVGGLMHALNHWVDTANKVTTTYSKWTRTMASPINDDYPVPVLTMMNDSVNFNSVGSMDSIYMLYEDNINDMWSVKKFDTITRNNPCAAMYLYDVQPGDTPDTVKITGNTAVRLYINEEIGITQPANAVLTARAGVTIKNDRKGSNDQTDDPNWHLFSSAINEVPIGLDYHTTEEEYEGVSNYYVLNNFRSMMQSPPMVGSGKGIKNTYYWDRTCMDPPKTTWSKTNVGYFPTNTPYGTWRNTSDNGFFDLYTYSEEFYHWVNFKREGKPGFYDHWHMDASNDSTHEVLPYQNELTMPKGKGYMMALSSESMMMADGELNTGDVYTYVTVTPLGTNNPKPQHRYDEPWRMLNMIGNPYQSYLDFEKFVNDTRDDPNSNSDLLYCNSYATRDDKEGEFIFYTMEQSRNNRELMASQYIHPHQGFFVKAKIPGYLKFTDAMRVAGTNTSLGSNFRDINYPLVNLICYEPSGHRDFTTVEVNRPELGGGSKMQNLRTGNASIYAHFEDNDYQTLFTPMGVSTVPVWFETEEDGVFTLRWNTLHGDFNYLHLIDHIMGTDIDCLTTDEYIFEAKTSDYESRFRLVFDCVGVEEYEEDDLNSATFAFQMGDELVINGEGMLQMFDISGRCLMSTQTMGQQSSVSLPKTAAGLYLLRLTTDSQVKVQKMVIK